MPELTDEERAAAVLGDVEPSRDGDETTEEPKAPVDQEEAEADTEESEEQSEEEEKPTTGEDAKEEPVDSTLTKQFPNLKGETLAEYNHELETAYDNSFKEALRLNQVIKDNEAKVAEANRIIAQAGTAAPTAPEAPVNPATGTPRAPVVPPASATNPIADSPELEWIRAERRRVMLDAFDTFKQEYPQVLDASEFERFRLATDGAKASLTASTGREPTDAEIFKSVAGIFGWQPTSKEDNKNAAIKENASSSRASSGQSKAQAKPPKVSDDQITAYQKMFTSKTREEAIKELSEVV